MIKASRPTQASTTRFNKYQHGPIRRRRPSTDLAAGRGSGPKWRRDAIVPNAHHATCAENGYSSGALQRRDADPGESGCSGAEHRTSDRSPTQKPGT
eukprot:1588359-Pleurochrysis_carterae.AAC.2